MPSTEPSIKTFDIVLTREGYEESRTRFIEAIARHEQELALLDDDAWNMNLFNVLERNYGHNRAHLIACDAVEALYLHKVAAIADLQQSIDQINEYLADGQ